MDDFGPPSIPSGANTLRSNILLVDDEPVNRELILAQLPAGPTVFEAANGEQALAILNQENIDLVLLDVMMPGLSGFEVCRRMKLMRPEPFLPIVMLTAAADQASRNRGLEAGADDYLSKPVDRRELTLRVSSLLRMRRQDVLIRKQVHELQRLQHLKDDLMSLLVHDLRNPLAGVTGFIEMALEEVGPDVPFAGALSEALDGSRRVREILDEALQVRLIEEGAFALRPTPSDVEKVLSAAVASLKSMARARDVQLRMASERAGIRQLDARLVQRAVENLISNALKYTPSGQEVLVSATPRTDGIEIEVADRGPGIADGMKSDLFSKFSSVEARQGQSRRGIGFGLYLVRLVAEGHGGSVSVRDREGGGAVFALQLPAGLAA